MPRYFLVPLNVTLVSPVAAALAYADRHWFAGRSSTVRTAVAVPIVALGLLNVGMSQVAWARAYYSPVALEARDCKRHVDKAELIHTGNLHVRQSGADRLSYLGFHVDDRPLAPCLTLPKGCPTSSSSRPSSSTG